MMEAVVAAGKGDFLDLKNFTLTMYATPVVDVNRNVKENFPSCPCWPRQGKTS